MKRGLIVLLCGAIALAVCLGAALGEEGTPGAELAQIAAYTRAYDVDGDGAEELLTLRRAPGADVYGEPAVDVVLDIGGEAGFLAGGSVYTCLDNEYVRANASLRLRVYALGGGKLYAEGAMAIEGTETHYALYEMEGGALVQRVGLRDPGYSDGIGLEELSTGELLFESPDMDAALLVPLLDEAFAPCGVRFAVRDSTARAELPEAQLIFDVDVWQLPLGEGASAPAEGEEEPAPAEGEGDWVEASGTAHTTGDVNLREGPGLDYETVTAVPSGSELEYLGEESVDGRGVTWYRVRCYDAEGWGSSKYVSLD